VYFIFYLYWINFISIFLLIIVLKNNIVVLYNYQNGKFMDRIH